MSWSSSRKGQEVVVKSSGCRARLHGPPSILALPCTSCVTLGKLLRLFVLYLLNGIKIVTI